MITIKGTTQELFDKITVHLDQQGHPAISSVGSCRYWDKRTGDKCPGGALIPREVYNSKFDRGGGATFNTLYKKGILSIEPDTPSSYALLQAAQEIHDECVPYYYPHEDKVYEWEKLANALRALGRELKLDLTIFNKLQFIYKE